MVSNDIRTTFLNFFEKRGHAIVPSAPLVPENDPSVLFTTAGMQPLVPYLLGESHPSGTRIANVQKCVRTGDIEEVGDKTHDTFFEMLGNWSLGDYFKEDGITWSYGLLTSKEEGFGLDPKRLYITVFSGNTDAPRDEEAVAVWKKLGVPEHRIYYLEDNWWSPGESGPCGPDSEMFYDITPEGLGDLTHEEFIAADDTQQVVEIWNDVFMEYEKKDGKVIGKLAQKNVDTGAGLERLAMVLQGTDNIFDTDLFAPIMDVIRGKMTKDNKRAMRIVSDHIRTAVFLLADGVRPGNTDQGYILRRLLRRAVRYADMLGMDADGLSAVAEAAAIGYENVYQNVVEQKNMIVEEIRKEEEKFRSTLEQGMKEFEKILARSEKEISGNDAFVLFSTYGFPFDMTSELAEERGFLVDKKEFEKEMDEHRASSRTASEGKFKGGLAGTSEKTMALHTATHLLLAGLRNELGEDVHQAGSNITEERLRFDFTYPEKVERDILDRVESFVNGAITQDATVRMEEMGKGEAKAAGVEGSFWEKYPDTVRVYTIEGKEGAVYSRELCGGPHVEHTGDMGTFRIKKEESSSAGVRRIKAVLG
ncbi:MAG: alanine--tRNA ligase [Parcubacteria group bacterium]|nr:alanine--tRNA ligase [Parcubacteria group bacterium]